ncbi:MAG: hypothetical protein ABW173_11745, partial [Sphingomonas sp.]
MEDVKEMSSPPAPGGYIGAIDEDRQGRLSGWAITREGDACAVTVTVNGRDFTTRSTLPRLDLAAKRQSRGQGGWRIDVSEALVAGENEVEARLPDGTPLAGSPRTLAHVATAPATTRYIGAVDTANGSLLSGWALTTTGDPCALAVRIGDAPAITLVSHGTRADLADKGMSNGAGGWHLFLEGLLSPGPNTVAIVLPDGAPLSGSPLRLEGPAAEAPATPPPPVAVVADFPERPRAAMPSLAELDEVSLDDVALAVASGRVRVESPEAPPPAPPP